MAEGAEEVSDLLGDYIYVIRYEARLHKVGFSAQPVARLAQLQAGEPRHLSLVKTWPRPKGDAQRVESRAHSLLAPWRDSDDRYRERFWVSDAVACAAVEMAIAVVADISLPADPISRHLAPSHIETLAALAGEPAQRDKLAYIRLADGEHGGDWIVSMRRRGVDPDGIFFDRPGETTAAIGLMKDVRAGDEVLLSRDGDLSPEFMARIIEKGATVRVLK